MVSSFSALPSICLALLLPFIVVAMSSILQEGMVQNLPRFSDIPLPPSDSLPPQLGNIPSECQFFYFTMNTFFGQMPKWAIYTFFNCDDPVRFTDTWCLTTIHVRADALTWTAHAPTGLWTIVALTNRTAAECTHNYSPSFQMPVPIQLFFANLRRKKRSAAIQHANDDNTSSNETAVNRRRQQVGKLLPDPHFPGRDVPRKFAKRVPTPCKIHMYSYNTLDATVSDERVLKAWHCQSFSDNWCLSQDDGFEQQWNRRSVKGFYTLAGLYGKYDLCAL